MIAPCSVDISGFLSPYPGIEIYLLEVPDDIEKISTSFIPPDQLQDIKNYRNPLDVRKRLLARTFLYESIATKLGCRNFTLLHNTFKKPSLAALPDFYFSFSYSSNFVLVGISTAIPFGIDIERIDTTLDTHEIAPDIMSAPELDRFRLASTEHQQRHFFFHLFSTKESIIKAWGTGLYFDVRRIDITRGNKIKYGGNLFRYFPLSFGDITQHYCLSLCHAILR